MNDRFRKLKKQSRRLIHDEMSVGAVFCNLRNGTYEIWNGRVRVTNKIAHSGDLKGTNYHYAEYIDDAPRILFLTDEGAGIGANTFVGIDDTEIYQLTVAEPIDVITQTYKAARLDGDDLAKYAKIMFPKAGE